VFYPHTRARGLTIHSSRPPGHAWLIKPLPARRLNSGVADNDFDSTGQALLEEFTDAVCACLPIEGSAISFAVESVSSIPAGGAFVQRDR